MGVSIIAIAQRMGGARAMAAMLQGADVANLNQIATLQYLCALEGVLEDLERLHDCLWELIERQVRDNATPETASLLN
jgi:hypothetical protein